MFERIRAALPALCLAGACVIVFSPAASAASSPPAAVYVDSNNRAVVVVNAAGDSHVISMTGALANDGPTDVVVSRDGRTAYVAYTQNLSVNNTMGVLAIDLATDDVSVVVDNLPDDPLNLPRLALTPNGSSAFLYADADVYRVNLAAGTTTGPWHLGSAIGTLAVSPDGTSIYATSGTKLLKLSATSGAQVDSLDLGQPAGNLKLSTDGRTAYVIGNTSNTPGAQLFKVDLGSFTVVDHAALPGLSSGAQTTALAVALSPDQTQLYVISYEFGRSEYFAVPVRASDLHVGTPFDLIRSPEPQPAYLDAAFSADGTKVFTYSSGRGDGEIVEFDASSHAVTAIPPTPISGYHGVATPPDQAPVAAFRATAACAGKATAFDASASTVAQGTIVRYAWNFGDGTKKVTTTPKVTHAYAKPGSYAASVTETDSAGTSTTVVFDGQNVVRNGGPSARARHTIAIDACSVPVQGGTGTSVPGTPASDADLAMTGSDTGPALALAGGLIVAGAALVRGGRRRTSRPGRG